MADYYPLIARAIGGLSDRSPGMRNAVYTRARDALMGQLRSLDPPLPEAAIEQERTALEAAIARVEREQDSGAPGAAPAASPRPQPAPAPAPETPSRPRPATAPAPAAGSPPRATPPRDPAPTGQNTAAREVKPAPPAPPARPLPAAAQPERPLPPPLGQPRPAPAPAPAATARPRPDPAPAPAASARPRPETIAPLSPPRPRPEPGAPPAGARPAAEAPPPARPRLELEAGLRAARPEPEPPPRARSGGEPAAAAPARTQDEPAPAPTGFKLPVPRDRTRPPSAERPSPPAAAAPGARRPAIALAGGEPAVPDAAPAADADPASPEPADAETGDAFATPETDLTVRPRIGTQAPVTVNPGRGRSLILGAVLVVVIGLIGFLAWTLRDRPDELPRPGAVAEAPSPAEGAKIGERVGGPPSPVPAAPAAPTTPEPRPAPRVEANANPMAVLYEEDQDNPQVPKTTGGRVTWRTDALNAGQGQHLDTAIRATVEIPEAGFTLSLVIRRNLDATLPASHTVELNFTTRPGDPARVVRDVGVLQFRNDVNTRGTPVAGLPVPVRDNLFLIGLSNLPIDLDRNMELLRRRNWIDLPIRMASGQRAIVSFEKGAPGEAVVADAVRQWQQ